MTFGVSTFDVTILLSPSFNLFKTFRLQNGLLINFNVVLIKNGIRRVVNNL